MVSLKDFDFFPKTLEDYRVRTYAGAAVSVVSMIIIVLLFISELSLYFSTTVRVLSSPSTSYCELAGRSYERGMISPQVEPHLFVDTSRGQKLRINLDITFNRLPCACMCHIFALVAHSLNNTDDDEHVADLSVDAMDISGEAQLDVVHNIYKRRLSSTGAVIPEAEGTLHIPAQRCARSIDRRWLTRANLGRAELATRKVDDAAAAAAQVPVPKNANSCESCYGAETPGHLCCPTCESVREAYRIKGWAFVSPSTIAQVRALCLVQQLTCTVAPLPLTCCFVAAAAAAICPRSASTRASKRTSKRSGTRDARFTDTSTSRRYDDVDDKVAVCSECCRHSVMHHVPCTSSLAHSLIRS